MNAQALVGALAIAWYARLDRIERLYVGDVPTHCAMMTLVAIAQHALPSGAALLRVGFGRSGLTMMQITPAFLAAPSEMRCRMWGKLTPALVSGRSDSCISACLRMRSGCMTQRRFW
jgi:hypothetical protein